jgi:dolichol-phosphate mannosyltransferase
MTKTMVILPTYNEAPNLRPMVEALMALPFDDLYVLVVDDNSPDGTGDIADTLVKEYPGRVHVLHNQNKGGFGPAYKLGFRRALELGAEYIIQMDCDFSHQPKYIPDLIARADEGYDLVIGSRYVKGGGVERQWSWFRKLLSWFANRVYVRFLLNIDVNDATAGFRLWKRDTLIGIDLDRVRSNGYVFQVELAYLADRLGFKIAEAPIYFPDRLRGESKMRTRIMLEASIRVFQIRWQHRSLNPQKRRHDAYQPLETV